MNGELFYYSKLAVLEIKSNGDVLSLLADSEQEAVVGRFLDEPPSDGAYRFQPAPERLAATARQNVVPPVASIQAHITEGSDKNAVAFDFDAHTHNATYTTG